MSSRSSHVAVRPLVGLALALALAATGCGTRLSDAELQAQAPGLSLGEGGPAGTGPAIGDGGQDAETTVGPGTTVGGSGAGTASGGGGTSGSGGSGPTGPTKSEILLGSYGTQSGIVGAVTAPFVAALRAWVADVNARGGLNGHPVRLLLADDGGDPGRAVQIARRMFEEQKVLFFFGTHGATTQGAVTPYQNERRIPVVGGVQHQDADTSPMIFLPQLGATKGVRRSYLVTTVVQTPKRKVGLVWSRECGASCANTVSEMKAYAPKVGVSVVYEAQVSLAQPDYTGEVIAARNAGVEAMLMQLDPPSVGRFVRSARRQGWHPVFVSGGALHVDSFLEYGEDVEGVLAVSTLAPYSISPRMAPYRDAIRRYVPGAPLGDYGAQAWAGGKLLEAIASHLGDMPTREQVLRGLWSLRGDTLGGIVRPLTFPRGSHQDVNVCIVPIKVAGGRWAAPLGDRFYCATDSGIRTL